MSTQIKRLLHLYPIITASVLFGATGLGLIAYATVKDLRRDPEAVLHKTRFDMGHYLLVEATLCVMESLERSHNPHKNELELLKHVGVVEPFLKKMEDFPENCDPTRMNDLIKKAVLSVYGTMFMRRNNITDPKMVRQKIESLYSFYGFSGHEVLPTFPCEAEPMKLLAPVPPAEDASREEVVAYFDSISKYVVQKSNYEMEH